MTSPHAEPFVPSAQRESPASILLVDDSEGNLISLEVLLEGIDVVPVRARNAQEALAHLLRDEFALVILDVRMPDMSGIEVASLLRRHPRHKDLPIIFATAHERTPEEVESA